MKSSIDRQTGLSSYSYHGAVVVEKKRYHFEEIFEVILLFENLLIFWLYIQIKGLLCYYSLSTTLSQRSHLSGCHIEAETKWPPFSQIINTPNWLALTPIEYMLPYHLKQILFCGCYTTGRQFADDFAHSLHENGDIVIVYCWHWGQSKNGHYLQMEFPNSCLFVWKLLYFDYKFTIRPKRNGHHFTENTLHIHFLVWILVWFH